MNRRPTTQTSNSADADLPTLVLIVDGWSSRIVRRLLDAQALEGFARLVSSGQYHPSLQTPIPSVSIASHTSIATGCMPGEHQIPAHRWTSGSCFRNYIGPQIVLANRDISSSVKTLFEQHRGRSAAVQMIVSRGATNRRWYPTLNSKFLLRSAERKLVRDQDGLVMCWLPKGDSIAHRKGPDSSEFKREILRVDNHLSGLLDRLNKRFGKKGYRLVVTPDHGQKAIERHVDPRDLLSDAGVESCTLNRRRKPGAWMVATSGDSAAGVYPPSDVSFGELKKIAMRLSLADGVDHAIVSQPRRLGGGGDHTFYPTIESHPQTEHRHRWTDRYIESWNPDRSPPILLLASPQNDFAGRRRIGWGFGFHRGSHGGATADEMLVDGFSLNVRYEQSPRTIADLTATLYSDTAALPAAMETDILRPAS